uniref:Uncharacterized protein n=1 Tax=Romanomermis culicivorax TaxID=13658 RepID=A0A915IQQ7_ROMCU
MYSKEHEQGLADWGSKPRKAHYRQRAHNREWLITAKNKKAKSYESGSVLEYALAVYLSRNLIVYIFWRQFSCEGVLMVSPPSPMSEAPENVDSLNKFDSNSIKYAVTLDCNITLPTIIKKRNWQLLRTTVKSNSRLDGTP